MKRKLVQQGSSTLMISLPSKWIKSFELKKGDEIDLEEQENGLFIQASEIKPKEAVKIDVSNLHPLTNRTMVALYTRGIDEIEVKFSDPKEIKDFQKRVINELIGFEIIKQSSNYMLIKDITGTKNQDIDEIIQRIFLILDSMSEEFISALENKQDLEPIVEIDLSVNKLVHFCLRILNKQGYKQAKKTPQIYSIISSLEEIGDLYKRLALKIKNNKIKITKEEIEILKELRESLSMFKKLLSSFSKEDSIQFARKYETIKSKINQKKELSDNLFNLNETIVRMNNHLFVISDF